MYKPIKWLRVIYKGSSEDQKRVYIQPIYTEEQEREFRRRFADAGKIEEHA